MKKVFAFGVTGLLMLGTASQASAAFEAGHFILSVFDSVQQVEKGFDLGANIDLSYSHTLMTGLDFSGLDRDNGHVALWSDKYHQTGSGLSAVKYYDGYFATTSNTGVASIALTGGSAFHSSDLAVRGVYDDFTSGVASISTTNVNSYYANMSLSDTVSYAGLNLLGGNPKLPAASNYVDMYLYQFATGADKKVHQVGSNYAGVIRLSADGTVAVVNEVPVPGAVWLLGSGLVGLAGLRRKKNG